MLYVGWIGWNGWMAIIGHMSSNSTFGAKCLLFTNTNFTRKNLFELFLSPQEMHLMSIQSLTTEWCKKMSKNASRKHQFVFKDNLPFSVSVASYCNPKFVYKDNLTFGAKFKFHFLPTHTSTRFS